MKMETAERRSAGAKKGRAAADLRIETYDYCDWGKAHEFSDLINVHDTEVTGEKHEQWFSVFLYDGHGKTVGGVAGLTSWGLCEVSALAVAKRYRHMGWGTRLVAATEQLARRRRCTCVHLHSMNFQAAAFYQKLGYTTLARLKGGGRKYTRYFLAKKLS
jgi:ribosomal protein S18 acetylase RimI-like enzyme